MCYLLKRVEFMSSDKKSEECFGGRKTRMKDSLSEFYNTEDKPSAIQNKKDKKDK